MQIKITKQTTFWLKITTLITLFLTTTWYYQDVLNNWTGYYTRWMPCLDFIKEGTIYTGQPFCESGGPPLFFIPYFIREIVGSNLFQPAMIVVGILIHAVILYLLLKIIKKEVKNAGWFLPSFMYILIVYLPTTKRFETMLTLLFLISGFYVLLYKKTKYKHMITGVLFGLSILSKPSALVPVGFIILANLFKEKVIEWKNKKIRINIKKEHIINTLWLGIPTLLFIAYFRLKYKFFFIYYILNLTKQEHATSYFYAIKSIIFLNINTMSPIAVAVLVSIAVATYGFVRYRKLHAFLGGPVQLILFTMIVKSFSINIINERYWALLSPFFIITFVELYQKAKENKEAFLRTILCTALIIILIYPSLYTNPLNKGDPLTEYTTFGKQKLEFIRELHYPYQIIPPQEKILFEHSYDGAKEFFELYDVSVPLSDTELITRKKSTGTPDMYSLPRYVELLGDNLIYNPNEDELSIGEEEFITKINAGEYTFIHAGPPEWVSTNRLLSQSKINELGYCAVVVPSNVWLTKPGMHQAQFIFKDVEHCKIVLTKMIQYYEQNIDSICKKDQFSAEMIIGAIKANSIEFNKTCNSGGEMMASFKNLNIKNKYIVAVILLLTLLSFGIQHAGRKSSYTAKEKLYSYIIIAVLIALTILIWVLIQKQLVPLNV